MSLSVELFATGHKQRVALQDLSRSGMFLQLTPPLPVGTQIHVAMAPEGRRLVTAATVAHCLSEADARALGRSPGVGIAFRPAIDPADELFAIGVDRIVRAQHTGRFLDGAHIVVADPQTRVLERMSAAFGAAGFSVATAATGMEALAACFRRTPDVLLIERTLPLFDGFRVLEQMARLPSLATVPVMMMSSDPNDLAPAFECGFADFIAKPFSTLDVIARARHLAYARPLIADDIVLRGALEAMPLAALLSMLEQERKTGRLSITGESVAWIDLVDGRVVNAGSSAAHVDARATLMHVLDWAHGTFELSSTPPSEPDRGLAMSITHLLLEHARVRDESSRKLRVNVASA